LFSLTCFDLDIRSTAFSLARLRYLNEKGTVETVNGRGTRPGFEIGFRREKRVSPVVASGGLLLREECSEHGKKTESSGDLGAGLESEKERLTEAEGPELDLYYPTQLLGRGLPDVAFQMTKLAKNQSLSERFCMRNQQVYQPSEIGNRLAFEASLGGEWPGRQDVLGAGCPRLHKIRFLPQRRPRKMLPLPFWVRAFQALRKSLLRQVAYERMRMNRCSTDEGFPVVNRYANTPPSIPPARSTRVFPLNFEDDQTRNPCSELPLN
jgi:hypothetical protein